MNLGEDSWPRWMLDVPRRVSRSGDGVSGITLDIGEPVFICHWLLPAERGLRVEFLNVIDSTLCSPCQREMEHCGLVTAMVLVWDTLLKVTCLY